MLFLSNILHIFIRCFNDEIQNAFLVLKRVVPNALYSVFCDEVLNFASSAFEECIRLAISTLDVPFFQNSLVSINQQKHCPGFVQEAIIEKPVALNEHNRLTIIPLR